MIEIIGRGMDLMYWRMFDAVKKEGQEFGPRCKNCIEVRPAFVKLLSPELALYTGKDRKLNYPFFAIETLCYLGGIHGKNHADAILAVNPNMKFAINKTTGVFDGAYGRSFLRGLSRVYIELAANHDSRRGVVSIWEMEQDMSSNDVPCTCSLHFFVEKTIQGRKMLSFAVTMRSNDLNWGVPYDIAAFCSIQVAMAAALSLPVGVYYHTANSLHYYLDGNSDGEKPPTLKEPSPDLWLNDDNLYIPVPPMGTPILSVMVGAREIIRQFLIHVYNERPVHQFEYMTSGVLDNYFKHWESIIRWRRQKADTS